MKKIAIACLLMGLFYGQTLSQWSATQFGIALGGDIEMPHKLGHDYLLATAQPNDFDATGIPFENGELVRMDCDNGTFRMGMAFSPAGKPNAEIQFSLLSIDGRIDMVRYELPEPGHFAEVSATNKEIALEAVYLFRQQTTKTFSFYLGGGTNMGISHGGKVRIKRFYQTDPVTDVPATFEEINVELDQKDSFNQRLFVQGGFGIRFLKRMEFGLLFRKGVGYRASFDGPFRPTVLKRSIGLSLNYRLSK